MARMQRVCNMQIVTVLRSGGDFTPQHVQALQRQCAVHAPFDEFICLTDVGHIPGVRTAPLEHAWPGWWAKMNIFSPLMRGDFLYMDLDTVIVGRFDDLTIPRPLTLLRDFYRDGDKRREGLQSSLMFLPETDRAAVWQDFARCPAMHTVAHSRGGDQAFLEKHWLAKAVRWQDMVPGQIVSYKVHCQKQVPDNARVIIFHGQPRPWAVPQFKDLY